MAAVAREHEDNAVKVAEAASKLERPPNLRSPSSTGGAESSDVSNGGTSPRTNALTQALFMRKGKDSNKKKSNSKHNNSNSSKQQQKKEQTVETVAAVKQSEEAALSKPDTAQVVTEQDNQTDPVLDLADDLLDQLDAKDAPPDASTTNTTTATTTSTSNTTSTSKQPSTGSSSAADISKVPSESSNASSSATAKSSSGHKISHLFSKKNRHAAKLERRQAEMEAQREAAKREIEESRAGGHADQVEWERQKMMTICRSLNVEMVEMNPNGHCLYAAIAHQLNLQPARYMKDNKESFQTVRHAVAEHMRKHPDDFIAFLPSEDGLMTPEQFAQYCDTIENTAEWGGQPEILAVSNAYEVPVIVYQAGLPPLKIGEQFMKKLPLRISYHRKMYGLGEHYNSLRRKPEHVARYDPLSALQ